ncbi:hypothetical protein BLJ79_21495 [Arthrobacter sp. UCD-GKA]|uniref:sigma factor-like helix-turn-helix DNA-binding protein n=1 Tax=Arthrobacter sp. UCD-GKA TaxID=1913576 RepID=UPI0008DD9F51|nr:sigma factor-like helix-turn-helix DNA-binding protein [Arthrobacter sp. UCD-GKA]OIH81937.1 hypothetical protein BLJ79_21495 [Arthrobacter sp. UCD-GKA]
MLADSTPTPASSRREAARIFLRIENAAYQTHRLHRGYYARIAKEHGLTNQEIADEYGVTEAAVRSLIKRSVK